jgi:hypothetical protein
VVEPNVAGGTTGASAGMIALQAYKGKTVRIELAFDVATAPTVAGPEYIVKLDFTGGGSFVTVDMGGIHCGAGVPGVAFLPGAHKLAITMLVDSIGTVASMSCTVDVNAAVTSQLVPPSDSLILELGNVDSGSGNFRVVYDNVVVRAQ